MFNYDWDWLVIWQYREVLLRGVLVTLALTIISIGIGTLLGFCVGTFLSGRNPVWYAVRLVVTALVDVVRALPLLILLFVFYFWLPYVLGIESPLWIAILALSINLAAFIADVLRAAIRGVPKPLIEAAEALGMKPNAILRRVLIPEATRHIVPTVALLYIDVLKMSSLASVIAVNELVHKSAEISSKTFRFLEVYAALAVIYILIVLPFSFLARKLEQSPRFLRRS